MMSRWRAPSTTSWSPSPAVQGRMGSNCLHPPLRSGGGVEQAQRVETEGASFL